MNNYKKLSKYVFKSILLPLTIGVLIFIFLNIFDEAKMNYNNLPDIFNDNFVFKLLVLLKIGVILAILTIGISAIINIQTPILVGYSRREIFKTTVFLILLLSTIFSVLITLSGLLVREPLNLNMALGSFFKFFAIYFLLASLTVFYASIYKVNIVAGVLITTASVLALITVFIINFRGELVILNYINLLTAIKNYSLLLVFSIALLFVYKKILNKI